MIKSINLMSAGICNLNCSFCFLQNKKFKSVKEQHEKIIAAWKDGSYVKNLETYFIKNHQSFNEVEEFCFWGGESLLNIDVITPQIKNILAIFPNVQRWFVSTNFIININNFIELLKEIDNLSNTYQTFLLQLSIDGPKELIEKGHNGDWNIYQKNLDSLINYFNNNYFKYIHLEISINSVLAKEVFLEQFDTTEKIKKYFTYMQNFYNININKIISKNIKIHFENYYPKVDHLANLTLEERNKFLSIYNLFESIKKELNIENYQGAHLYYGINRYIMNNVNLISSDKECGALNTMLTLLPDGTEVRCSGAYMAQNDQHEQELKEEGTFNDLIIYSIESATANKLHNSQEEQENYQWNVKQGIKNTQKVYMKFMYNACIELLRVNQISEKYYDKNQLLKEITGLMRKFTCDEENVKETYIPFIPSLNLLRRYFNGLSNLIYQNTLIEEKGKWNLN